MNMNSIELNVGAIERLRRKKRGDGLSLEDRVALNLLWRRGVRATILAKIFNISKNTVYYTALSSRHSVAAKEAHEKIEREGGPDIVWRRYVTDDMIRRVNAELKAIEQGKG